MPRVDRGFAHDLIERMLDDPAGPALFAIDPARNYRLIFCSASASALLGGCEECLSGSIPELGPDGLKALWLEVSASGMATVETELRGRRGERIAIACRFSVLHLGGETLMAGYPSDISERRALQAECRRLSDDIANREVELRYREIYENVADGIFLLDVDEGGRFRLAGINPAMARMTGLVPAEVLGCYVDDIVPAASVKILLANYRRCLEQAGPIRYSVSVDFPGGPKTFESRLIPVRDGCGRIHRLIGLSVAVGEPKPMNSRQPHREQEFRTLVQNMPGVMVRYDSDGRFVFVNAKFEQLFGVRMEDVLGKTPTQVPSLPDAGFFEERVKLALQYGRAVEFEHPVRIADGCMIDTSIHIVPERDESGRVAFVQVVARNISERKAAEKQLELLNYALDHVKEAVALVGEDSSLHYVNEAFSRSLGYSRDELLALSVPDFDPDFQAQRWPGHWRELKANETLIFETRHRAKDGTISPVEINANYFEFYGKSFNLTLIRNIADRKRLEDTLGFIGRRGWKEGGESFLAALARYLGRNLAVDYVAVDKLSADSSRAETVALYAKGEIVPNLQYSLAGTPCANVMEGGLCSYPADVWRLFPEDTLLVEMGVESYIGLPLWDSLGKVIGLIALMDSRPMHDTATLSSTLQLVAARAAAELEREQSEQALARSRRFLEQVIDTIGDPLVVKDRQHRWILVNQACSELLGQSRDAILGKTDADFFSADQALAFQRSDERIFETGLESVNQQTITDANGIEKIIVTRKACFTDDTGLPVLVGILKDITALKQTERHLQETRNRLLGVLQTIPDYVWLKDLNGVYLACNQACENLYGASESEIVGKTDYDFVDRDSADFFRQKDREAIDAGRIRINEEWVTVAGEGRRVLLETRKLPVQGADGTVVGVLGIGRDITERKRVEAVQRQQEQEIRSLLDNSPDIIVRYDKDCRRIYLNAAHEALSRKPRHQMLGKTPLQDWGVPTGRQQAEDFMNKLRQVLETGREDEWELRWNNTDGLPVCYALRGVPEFGDNGEVVSVLTLARDISARVRAEQAMRAREREFRTLVENLPTYVVRLDRKLRRLYVNPAYVASIGVPEEELLGTHAGQFWRATNLSAGAYIKILRAVLILGEQQEVPLEWTREDGRFVSHIVRIAPEFGHDGEARGLLILGFDVTERRRQQLLEAERQRVFERVAHGDDLDGILCQVALYVEASRAGRRCLILLLDEEGTYLQSAAAPSFPPAYRENLDRILSGGNHHCPGWGAVVAGNQRILVEDLRQHSCLATCRAFIDDTGAAACWSEPIYSSANRLLGVVSLYQDRPGAPGPADLALLLQASHLSAIAIERKRTEQQLYRQASYDALTGLPNRRLFADRLHDEIARAERSGYSLALLFIDLDRFKEVNDSLGHAIGDRLLAEAAQRIRERVRESDTVARLAGDEFVVILPEAGDDDTLERIAHCLVSAMSESFHFGGQAAFVSASIGIAVYPGDAVHAEALISCADQAMYAAKASGRNGFSFFTRGMLEHVQHRLQLAADLRDALDKGQLELHFQPIVDISSGKVLKAEALLRWRHPELGMVPPDHFIPIAEEIDLIQDIGAWVFYRAAETALRWNRLCSDGVLRQISVNVSPRQFVRGNPDIVCLYYVHSIGLNPAAIVIEITEGLLLDDQTDVMNKLRSFQNAGMQLALDDFGTGYSAMAYLKKFNIDYLKIDKSFIRDLESDPGDRAIAEAIVVMGHRLGLKVIAEGVETLGQRDLLAAVGCEYVQGYLYAKPMAADMFFAVVGNGMT